MADRVCLISSGEMKPSSLKETRRNLAGVTLTKSFSWASAFRRTLYADRFQSTGMPDTFEISPGSS